jgi:hypothetical protein
MKEGMRDLIPGRNSEEKVSQSAGLYDACKCILVFNVTEVKGKIPETFTIAGLFIFYLL